MRVYQDFFNKPGKIIAGNLRTDPFAKPLYSYEISMKMAENRLLPAVREQAPATIICAAGVSCRQQIKHGSSRIALHPVEVYGRSIRCNP